jgi:hypothetical protein
MTRSGPYVGVTGVTGVIEWNEWSGPLGPFEARVSLVRVEKERERDSAERDP